MIANTPQSLERLDADFVLDILHYFLILVSRPGRREGSQELLHAVGDPGSRSAVEETRTAQAAGMIWKGILA